MKDFEKGDGDDLLNAKSKTGGKERVRNDQEEKFDYAADFTGDGVAAGDRRIKLLTYNESDVYTITTKYGYQTNIVFSPQEEIELISVGDRSLWQIIPSANRIFIRPMEEDVITNMTVLTNKRSYQFDLKSVSASKSSGNIYVAKFVYDQLPRPSGGSAATGEQAITSAPLPVASPFGIGPSVPSTASVAAAPPPPSPAAAPRPLAASSAYDSNISPNYSYTYTGSDALAPLQVYDDGRSTYLKLRDPRPSPLQIFIVDKTGAQRAATYDLRGNIAVIDAVAGEIVLKTPQHTVRIFNEMLNPG